MQTFVELTITYVSQHRLGHRLKRLGFETRQVTEIFFSLLQNAQAGL